MASVQKSDSVLRFRRPRAFLLILMLVVVVACRGAAPEDVPAAVATSAPSPTPAPTPTDPPPNHAAPAGLPQLDDAIASATATTGIVVATSAPDAVEAGVAILEAGGSAADAALATALAQVPLMPGNFITYAGIMEFLYYDAESGEISSLNASWDVPRAETEALTIPRTTFPYAGTSNPSGRTALVPGFMVGLESAHGRFGRLPFAALFEPAIAFAREGVVLDELQGAIIDEFAPVLTRLPDTAALFTRPDGALYQTGDRFRQPQMADVLERVARNGAAEMTTGDWGQAFVAAVQREGGTITLDDMAAYEAVWSEPARGRYGDLDVASVGLPGMGGVTLIEAVNLLAAADLGRYEHYSSDPEAMFWLLRIGRASVLSALAPADLAALFPGQDLSPEARLTEESAAWLWNQIQTGQPPLFNPPQRPPNTHSAAVVAVDGDGNIAALTHTSNAYLYGGTGLTVEGIYIPDPGSYMQTTLAAAGPGGRVPTPINPVIVLRDGRPVWASSAIGQVSYETFQRLAGFLVHGQDLLSVQHAPPLLSPRIENLGEPAVEQVFEGTFDAAHLEALRAMGQPVEEIPPTFENYVMQRGILAAVTIDPESGALTGAVPAALGGFAAGY